MLKMDEIIIKVKTSDEIVVNAADTEVVRVVINNYDAEIAGIHEDVEAANTEIENIKQNVTLLEGRVEELENDNGIILYYVVPVDTEAINLTVDKNGNPLNFQDGDEFEIVIQVKLFSAVNRINLRFNNNSNSIYKIGSSEPSFFYTAGSNYLSQYSSLDINLINGEVQGYVNNHSKIGTGGYTSQNYAFHTEGLNTENISVINLFLASTNSSIPAGTIIIIRRK